MYTSISFGLKTGWYEYNHPRQQPKKNNTKQKQFPPKNKANYSRSKETQTSLPNNTRIIYKYPIYLIQNNDAYPPGNIHISPF